MIKKDIELILNSIWESGDNNFKGYLIGGAALVLNGVHDSTKDIDIIFENGINRSAFFKAASKDGFILANDESKKIIHSESEKPVQIIKGDIVIDLFSKVTTHFCLTDSMARRGRLMMGLSEGAGIYCIIPQDIFILKSATGRNSDFLVAKKIMHKVEINWNEVIAEVIQQLGEGMFRAAYDLLELIQYNDILAEVPKWVNEDLIKMVEKRMIKIKESCKI